MYGGITKNIDLVGDMKVATDRGTAINPLRTMNDCVSLYMAVGLNIGITGHYQFTTNSKQSDVSIAQGKKISSHVIDRQVIGFFIIANTTITFP